MEGEEPITHETDSTCSLDHHGDDRGHELANGGSVSKGDGAA